jgi:hypothetical protein
MVGQEVVVGEISNASAAIAIEQFEQDFSGYNLL